MFTPSLVLHCCLPPIDIPSLDALSFTTHTGGAYASLLCQVSGEAGDQESEGHHHEERKASDTGCVPSLRHQDVQDREELTGPRQPYQSVSSPIIMKGKNDFASLRAVCLTSVPCLDNISRHLEIIRKRTNILGNRILLFCYLRRAGEITLPLASLADIGCACLSVCLPWATWVTPANSPEAHKT